jgi:hypothetical protein
LTADVQTDAGQPGAEAFRLPQAIDAEQGLDHRILRRIFGEQRIAKHPPTEVQEQGIVARDQRREGALIT